MQPPNRKNLRPPRRELSVRNDTTQILCRPDYFFLIGVSYVNRAKSHHPPSAASWVDQEAEGTAQAHLCPTLRN
jgi:hypothetical protein